MGVNFISKSNVKNTSTNLRKTCQVRVCNNHQIYCKIPKGKHIIPSQISIPQGTVLAIHLLVTELFSYLLNPRTSTENFHALRFLTTILECSYVPMVLHLFIQRLPITAQQICNVEHQEKPTGYSHSLLLNFQTSLLMIYKLLYVIIGSQKHLKQGIQKYQIWACLPSQRQEFDPQHHINQVWQAEHLTIPQIGGVKESIKLKATLSYIAS